MSKEIKWKRREEWLCVRPTFCVVVKHWTEDSGFRDEGPHRWGVYAYIYPKHPLFAEFKTDDIWQPPAHELPMHGGPSLFRRNWANDGKECCSVEIGADYHHDGDDCYTHDDEGRGVKADAAELVRWLAKCKPNPRGQGLRSNTLDPVVGQS